jgi:hypothetical protein
VVTVTGGHDTRVSLAALIAVRPGTGPRLIFRTHRARRGDKRKGFTEADYARFLDAAHQQLGGPVVLVWDGLNTHTSRAMRGMRMDGAERRRREFIRVNHPDRGGDPDAFIAGMRSLDAEAGSLGTEPLPRVVVVSHRSWLTRLAIAVAQRLRPGSRAPRVR